MRRESLVVLRIFLFLLTTYYSLLTFLWGQDLSVNLSNGVFFSKTILEKNDYSFYKSLLKVRGERNITETLKLDVEAHGVFYAGDYLDTSEWKNFISPLVEGRSKIDWEKRFYSNTGEELRWRIYRANLSYGISGAQFSLGRARNGFGNTRIFLSPLDRLDDLATFVSDELERPGSDSLQARYAPIENLHLKTGYLWASQNGNFRSYIHGQFLAREGLEIGLLAGRLEPKTDGFGLGVEKSIDESEFKWEATQNTREFEKQSLVFLGPLPQIVTTTEKQNFSRHLVSWERSFLGDWSLALEYFHNGRGNKGFQNYDFASLLRAEDVYLARDYVGFSLRKTLSPLWAARFEGIENQTDGSLAWSPQISFSSAGSALEASFKPSFYFGKSQSEFGSLPNRTSVALTVYF